MIAELETIIREQVRPGDLRVHDGTTACILGEI